MKRKQWRGKYLIFADWPDSRHNSPAGRLTSWKWSPTPRYCEPQQIVENIIWPWSSSVHITNHIYDQNSFLLKSLLPPLHDLPWDECKQAIYIILYIYIFLIYLIYFRPRSMSSRRFPPSSPPIQCSGRSWRMRRPRRRSRSIYYIYYRSIYTYIFIIFQVKRGFRAYDPRQSRVYAHKYSDEYSNWYFFRHEIIETNFEGLWKIYFLWFLKISS